MKLTGKIALITNVSHFMGPAITEEFCREGASVALHDRDERGGQALRADRGAPRARRAVAHAAI